MSRRPPTDAATIKVVKDMLFAGKPQERISAVTGVSQSTISRVKAGKSHGEVPWPDGSIGPLPERTVQEVNWSSDAQRYLTFPTPMQERILEVVNARRSDLSIPPIPEMSEGYKQLLDADPADAEWEAARLIDARKAEDERCATIIREFDVLTSEELDTRREQEALDIFEATRGSRSTPADTLPPPAPPPLTYDKMPWETVLELAPSLRIVQEAYTADACMKEAICIVFHALRNSQTSWSTAVAAKQVRETADVLRGQPEGAVAELEAYYK
jgi:hypothetical protein